MSFNRFMNGVAHTVLMPYCALEHLFNDGPYFDDDGCSTLGSRSSSTSSDRVVSSSRDEGPDYDCFWSSLSERFFRDDRDPDYASALARERDFHAFSQMYYPRKWLEQHGVWGAGAQADYRKERYFEHLRSERESRKKRKNFLVASLAALAVAGALFCYFKGKSAVATQMQSVPIQIRSVEKPKKNLSERTGIRITSTQQPTRVLEDKIETKPEQSLSERTGIKIYSAERKVKTLQERTGIKISSGYRIKKQEYQNT